MWEGKESVREINAKREKRKGCCIRGTENKGAHKKKIKEGRYVK